MDKGLLDYLYAFITDNKKEKIDAALNERTQHISVVLENIYQSHNASAVLRSCEVFGIQNVNIIENNNTFTLHPKIVMGATKWLSLARFDRGENNTLDCINDLKKKNYRIIATSPYAEETIESLDLQNPIAFMFGTELTGLSDQALELADGYVKIPMYGFTESFNISVSASILLYEITRRLRSENIQWKLTEDEKKHLKYKWVKKILKNSDRIEQEYHNKFQNESNEVR